MPDMLRFHAVPFFQRGSPNALRFHISVNLEYGIMNHEPKLPQSNKPNQPTRREFLTTSGVAIAGGTLAASLGFARNAHAAANDDTIKIALIGCGGRGTGAARDAISGVDNIKIVTLADAFEDKLDETKNQSLRELVHDPAAAGKFDVPKERRFFGFDAYQQAINSGVDMVILATPPGFRPIHFEAAVKAGKNIFSEKPVATDAPGVRRFLAANEEAKKQNLKVGIGLQRHHQLGYQETMKRLKDGAIGDIVATRVYWNGDRPWQHTRSDLQKSKKDLTEMEYQMRNWYYFVWLCGDHIVEQHIHNLDVSNWLKDGHPVKASGMGGSQRQRGPDDGEIFDHHCVEFEYADGSKMFSQCRHIRGCEGNVSEHAIGTKGTAALSSYDIRPTGGENWRHTGRPDKPYQVEHIDLFAAIREGRPYNEGDYGANSTMTAILGRLATYGGKTVTWDNAINSNISVMPTEYAWDATPPVVPGANGMYSQAVPGLSKVV
jgi:myo-inositol 2-dehydrogenase / D-chiro-inositol 1-dehydrogenase